MSTQRKAMSPRYTYTMDVNLITIFLTIILASSLIEFNKLLFPPKIASPNFLALLSVYYCTFSVWFALRVHSQSRPYTDSPLSRARIVVESLALINYAGLLYYSSRAADSLYGYLWGWVVNFILTAIIMIIRGREFHLPEPLKPTVAHGLLALAAAITYSVWASVYPPITGATIWGFVTLMSINIISWRLRFWLQQVWRPEYDKRLVKQ